LHKSLLASAAASAASLFGTPSGVLAKVGPKRADTDVVAIYFPSWHANPHYQSWWGRGFSEWELLKSAKPRYPGH
jgi:hypothetical protein